MTTTPNEPATELVWDEPTWIRFERETRQRAMGTTNREEAWSVVARSARRVMRTYTTSFFMVSRFLPPAKRDRVEVIYSTVRYPDEVVDSFPLDPPDRLQRLEVWGAAYETALNCGDLRASMEAGVPCFLAGFAEVVRETGIPPEHYRSFLAAMRMDVTPRPFRTLEDLIESYIYGSAIVVGYFLAYVYGAASPDAFPRALESARDLGIGLQLTNFLRDVGEDLRRGRMYLPQDRLRAEGVECAADPADPECRAALGRVARQLATAADGYYRRATANLDAFAPDSQIAIRACIDVYGRLNKRIERSDRGIDHRESVPLLEKLRTLPLSGLWRIPKAWILP
ncbi:MAG: phytoene/squalene synthase family protein [Kiritimatiellia bacterium]|nr:phytoene/squalene synthase family protein [Kiritimatiellia bacterium]